MPWQDADCLIAGRQGVVADWATVLAAAALYTAVLYLTAPQMYRFGS